MLFACTPAERQADKSLAPIEETDGMTPATTIDASQEEDTLLRDARWYAGQYGVSLEEAMHRLRLQGPIGELGSTLSTSEYRTFAGLWIEHEPAYQVVVAFTDETGEEILRPYIEGQPYEEYVTVRRHRYSLAELRAAQQEVLEVVDQLDIPISSDIEVQHNRVTLIVGNPGLLLEEIQDAGLALPEMVEAVAIDPDNLSDSNRGMLERFRGAEGQVIYFPKQAPALVYHEGEFEGVLALDENGCLRIESEWLEAPLVIWQHDHSLHLADGEVEILDGNERVVARVGAPLRGGGGMVTTVHIPEMPLDACPGPYWLLGAIDS